MRRGCDWADRSDLHVLPGGVSTATLQVLARGTIVVESNNGTGGATLGRVNGGDHGDDARLMLA